ncbi:MAG: hypothetical protein ACI4SJ_07300 [Candidatus Avispirillum sp.]
MPDQFTEWRNNYNREKYDRYSLMLPKGGKTFLRFHAAGRGESLNAWINRAIMRQLEDEGGTLPEGLTKSE